MVTIKDLLILIFLNLMENILQVMGLKEIRMDIIGLQDVLMM